MWAYIMLEIGTMVMHLYIHLVGNGDRDIQQTTKLNCITKWLMHNNIHKKMFGLKDKVLCYETESFVCSSPTWLSFFSNCMEKTHSNREFKLCQDVWSSGLSCGN